MALHYHVDLRSFPDDERIRLCEHIKVVTPICNSFLDKEHFGIYDVFWESSEPIEDYLKIPSEYIIPQF